MLQPFKARVIDIILRAKGPLIQLLLRALIYNGALITAERRAVLFIFEKILPHFGADFFHEKPKTPCEWVIAQNGMGWVKQIAEPKCAECGCHNKAQASPEAWCDDQRQAKAERCQACQTEADEAGRKGKAQAAGHVGTFWVRRNIDQFGGASAPAPPRSWDLIMKARFSPASRAGGFRRRCARFHQAAHAGRAPVRRPNPAPALPRSGFPPGACGVAQARLDRR